MKYPTRPGEPCIICGAPVVSEPHPKLTVLTCSNRNCRRVTIVDLVNECEPEDQPDPVFEIDAEPQILESSDHHRR